MTIRNERSLACGAYAICGVAAASCSPAAWSGSDRVPHLLLLWMPLLLVGLIALSIGKGSPPRSREFLNQRGTTSTPVLLFILLMGVLTYGVCPLMVLGKVDEQRLCLATVCVMVLLFVFVAPTPEEWDAPRSTVARYCLVHWRWCWAFLSLIALGGVLFTRDPSSGLLALGGLSFTHPSTWNRRPERDK